MGYNLGEELFKEKVGGGYMLKFIDIYTGLFLIEESQNDFDDEVEN